MLNAWNVSLPLCWLQFVWILVHTLGMNFQHGQRESIRAFTATAIRHNVQSCNTGGTNEEPKGLRLTHQTCSSLYSKCTCISGGKCEGCRDEERDSKIDYDGSSRTTLL